MKALRIVLLILVALLVSAAVGHRASAQRTGSRGKSVAEARLVQLFSDLSASGQTNITAQVAGVLDAQMALQHSADIGMTVGILERLRSGRTNEAINLLETRLDSALMGFGFAPRDARDASSQRMIEISKQYRAKFPRKTGVVVIDTAVARALEQAGN